MDIFPLNIVNNYSSLHGLPEFVKQAAVVTDEEVKSLPQTAFADPLRKLPIHNKAATWCSHLAYYTGAVHDKTEIAPVMLDKAAAYFSIGAECRELKNNLTKAARPRTPTDADFALVEQHEGQKVRDLPIAGAQNIKQSSDALVASISKYPLPWRRKAANKLLKRAQDLSVALVNEHQLQQAAGLGMAKASEIVPHLKIRAKLVKDPAIRECFDKMAVEISKLKGLDQPTLAKMAEAIDKADRASGLYQYYGRGVCPPEEVCHRHTLHEYEEKRASVIGLTNGKGVNKEALAKLPAAKFTLLGDDFVNAIADNQGNVDVKKAEAIIPTLPADDAQIFYNCL